MALRAPRLSRPNHSVRVTRGWALSRGATGLASGICRAVRARLGAVSHAPVSNYYYYFYLYLLQVTCTCTITTTTTTPPPPPPPPTTTTTTTTTTKLLLL